MKKHYIHFLSLCLAGGVLLGCSLNSDAVSGKGVPRTGSPAAGTSQVTLSPSSLSFGNQLLTTKSAAQTVTVTNVGSTPLNFVNIVASGDYSQTNNCGTSLQPQANCAIRVTFSPSATGQRTGYITLNDTDVTFLQTVNLSGTGTAVSTDVAVTPGVVSLTLTQSQQFQATLSGSPTSDVSWAVDRVVGGNSTVGTISTTGLYTPPAIAGQHIISATVNGKPAELGFAIVHLTNYLGVFNFRDDIAQTGQNLNESVLTTGNVNSQQFGKLFSYPVDGYVWPDLLYVANVSIPGQGVHNVLYVADEHDSVYAFDADGLQTTPLWQTSFIDPPTITTIPWQNTGAQNIVPEVGITGTPVIDAGLGRIYVVAATYNTANGNYYQNLHALDITTGADVAGSPVLIDPTISGTGSGSSGGTITFDALRQSQRPGLMLMKGVVYVSFASRDDIDPYHGWVVGYDARTLQQVQLFNDSPNGARGGIWQGGQPPSADSDGNIYIMTGNGTFDASTGGTEYGDSFIKLSTSGSDGIGVVDYFTPYNQAALAQHDVDLGSGGPMVIPDQAGPYPHMVVGAGKEGIIFLVDRDDMGGFNPNNNNQIIQSVTTGYIATSPAFWQNNIYFSPVGQGLSQFQLYNGALSTAPIAQSTPKLTTLAPRPPSRPTTAPTVSSGCLMPAST